MTAIIDRMRAEKYRTFEVTEWFKTLLEGKLFGVKKDGLILRILKLGGKRELGRLCGMRFTKTTVTNPRREPSLKKLLLVLAEVESFQKEMDRRQKEAKRMIANASKYKKKRIVQVKNKNFLYSMEVWSPKRVGS